MNLFSLISYYLLKPRRWTKCRLSRGWEDAAHMRHMNNLSPHMPDGEFKRRVRDMAKAGCDHAHVFLCNKADGQYAGYRPDPSTAPLMARRMGYMRKHGLAVFAWLMADDSTAWAKEFAEKTYQRDIAEWQRMGLFRDVSAVVIGLEVNEYWKRGQCEAIAKACAERLPDRVGIGIHMTSGQWEWARIGAIDFLEYQQTNGTVSQRANEIVAVRGKLGGKRVGAFEMAWSPDHNLCLAMLKAGAWSVGNW